MWIPNGTSKQKIYLTVMHSANDLGLNFYFRYQTASLSEQDIELFYYYLMKSCAAAFAFTADHGPYIRIPVYRMVNLLEEIGAISRRNMYKIVRNPDCKDESVCTIELDDNSVQKLSKDSFNNVVLTGLKACGYIDKQEIERMFVNSCDFKH